jgi:hypothetical protein
MLFADTGKDAVDERQRREDGHHVHTEYGHPGLAGPRSSTPRCCPRPPMLFTGTYFPPKLF